MTTQNKQLTVYLSKSLQLSDKYLNPIRKILVGLGFKVTEYKSGVYSDKDLKEADFVLLVPNLEPSEFNHNSWRTTVGKGQYSEARECYISGKPLFIYHDVNEELNDILMSKMNENDSIYKPSIIDANDWKYKYGVIPSYVFGSEPVNLYPFIEGYFKLWINQYPLTPSECFKSNYHLLLLK